MSEDNEYDNEWGTKKQKYYSMNKRENNSAESDSDFIEDEKEAIRLQKLRAQKIKKYQTLKEEEELSENEDKNVGIKNKEKKEEDVIGKDIKFNKVEVDDNKIFENIEGLKYSLDEMQNIENEIKIFEDNKILGNKLPKTLEYLKEYKKFNVLYSANVLFYIISALNKNMTGHHPSIKNSAIFNYLLTKNAQKNEEIQNNIEKLILNLDKDKNENDIDEENEEEQEEIENEDNIDENDEEDENDIEGKDNEEPEEDFGEDIEEKDNEESEENVEEDIKEEEDEELDEDIIDKKNKKNDNNKKALKVKEKPSEIKIQKKLIDEKIKKPSFLNKKKKRSINSDSKKEEDFDSFSQNEKKEEDPYIKDQYKSFDKLNEEKEKLDLKKKEEEKKEISNKNEFAIRKANKEVLKARGIVRKRRKYQGNAKLMNREKYYKKEKLRKKLVKEYEGKPDVYMGEATGIRRDLIRSVKIH